MTQFKEGDRVTVAVTGTVLPSYGLGLGYVEVQFDGSTPVNWMDPSVLTLVERPVELLDWGVGTVLKHTKSGDTYVKVTETRWYYPRAETEFSDDEPPITSTLRKHDVVEKNYEVLADPAGVWD